MFCPNCGKETEPGFNLCPDCMRAEEDRQQRQRAHEEWRAQIAQKLDQKAPGSNNHSSTTQKSSFCTNCGTKLTEGAAFCSSCGERVNQNDAPQKAKPVINKNPSKPKKNPAAISCIRCGSANIDIQVHQENQGSRTVTHSRSKYREKGHGCLWWLIFGWWWWMVDLFLWVFFFPIRLVAQLLKKKKYVGTSSSVSKTNNSIQYRTVYLCKDCGTHWEV